VTAMETAPRKWFDFDKLEVTGVDPITPLSLPPAVLQPLQYQQPSGWVERRGGDFCGCCGANADGNCCGLARVCEGFSRPQLVIDEYGRLVSKPRLFGLDPLNIVGLFMYLLIIACAILLFYAMSLVLNEIAATEAGSGEVSGTLRLHGLLLGVELGSGVGSF